MTMMRMTKRGQQQQTPLSKIATTMMMLMLLFQTLLLLLLLHVAVVQGAILVRPRHCGGAIRHVHLAVGNDPTTSMTVSFASIPSYYTPAPIAGVAIGTEPQKFHVIVVEDAATSPNSYNVTVNDPRLSNGPPKTNNGDNADNDNDPPRYWSPYYHHITITGLEADTVYYYQPIVAGSRKDLHRAKPNLRHAPNYTSTTTAYTHTEAKMAIIESSSAAQHEWEPDEEENDDEFILFEHEDNSRRRNRRRLNPPPYDGYDKKCPEPTKIRHFRTAPKLNTSNNGNNNNNNKPTRMAIVGDLGQFPHSEETLQRLYKYTDAEFDSMILAGDIAYTGTDGRRWDTFFDFWDDTPLAERIPIQICPGNHDIDKIAEGKDIFLAYEHRFRMPRFQPPQLGTYEGPTGPLNMDQPPFPLPYEYGNAYYSYAYGHAQVFMLSSYSAMEPGSKQHTWLEQGLKAVDRNVTPWVLIVIHTPIYSTFSLHRKDPQIFAAMEHLEPLFVKYEANFVFSGHIHAYLRTKPVRFRKLHRKGPMHITVGAGGRKCEAPFLNATAEDFVAVRDATKYGYGLLHIHNKTTATWDWIHTGHTDNRNYNQVFQSDEQLPEGPGMDRVVLENQYFL